MADPATAISIVYPILLEGTKGALGRCWNSKFRILRSATKRTARTYKSRGLRKSHLYRWFRSPSFASILRDLSSGKYDEGSTHRLAVSFLENSGFRAGQSEASLKRATEITRIFLGDLLDEVAREDPALIRRRIDRHVSTSEASDQEIIGVIKENRDLLLQMRGDDAPLKRLMDRDLSKVTEFLDAGRLSEASDILTDLIETLLPGPEAGDFESLFVNEHINRLRLLLCNVLAWRGKDSGAQEVLALVDGPERLTTRSRLQLAKALLNLNLHDRLKQLLPLFEIGSSERNTVEIWIAAVEGDYAFQLDHIGDAESDPHLLMLKARAVIAGGGDYVRAVELLDRAWAIPGPPRQRIQIASAAVDTVLQMVHREAEASGVDRRNLCRSVSLQIETAIESALDPHQRGLGLLKLFQWFNEQADYEGVERVLGQFDDLDLEDEQVLLIRFDQELSADQLERIETRGQITTANALRLRAVRQAKEQDGRLAKSTLWVALDAATTPSEKQGIAHQLAGLYIDEEDFDSVRELIKVLGVDDPGASMLSVRLVLAEKGEKAAHDRIKDLLTSRPRLLMAHQLFIDVIRSQLRDSRDKSGGDTLFEEGSWSLSRQSEIMPSPMVEVSRARLIADSGLLRDAIEVYTQLEKDGFQRRFVVLEKASLLKMRGLFSEAARAMEDAYDRDESDLILGMEAAHTWIEATHYAEAALLLKRITQRHVDGYAEANLAAALMMSEEASERAEAYDHFLRSLNILPDLNIPPFDLYRAAAAAGDDTAAAKHFAEFTSQATQIPVESEEDIRAAMSVEGGAVLGFRGRDQLRIFAKLNAKWNESITNLWASDAVSYGDFSRTQGAAWVPWLSRCDAYLESRSYEGIGRGSIRGSWPTVSLQRLLVAGLDQLPGFVLDITAILTLASIDQLDTVLRACWASRKPLYLYPGALRHLRSEISASHAILGFDQRNPEEILQLLAQSKIESPTEDPDVLKELVPEPAQAVLGNQVFDVGYAIHVKADFVDRKTEFFHPDEAKWGGRTFSSKQVLRSLVASNLLSRPEADAVAQMDEDEFGGWSHCDPEDIDRFVLSHSVVERWYTTGLLEKCLSGGERWPKVHLGHFCIDRMRTDARLARRERLIARLKSVLSTLETLIGDGCVEPLEAEPVEPKGEARIWARHAELVLSAAKERGLALWVDDRFFDFIFWDHGFPLGDPEFEKQRKELLDMYRSVQIVGSEAVISLVDGLEEPLRWELGYSLFRIGYRPLIGYLALKHALTQYEELEQPPYKWLYSLVSSPTVLLSELIPAGRSKRFGQIAANILLTTLLGYVWRDDSLSLGQKRQVGDFIIDVAVKERDAFVDLVAGENDARSLVALLMTIGNEQFAPSIGLSETQDTES